MKTAKILVVLLIGGTPNLISVNAAAQINQSHINKKRSRPASLLAEAPTAKIKKEDEHMPQVHLKAPLPSIDSWLTPLESTLPMTFQPITKTSPISMGLPTQHLSLDFKNPANLPGIDSILQLGSAIDFIPEQTQPLSASPSPKAMPSKTTTTSSLQTTARAIFQEPKVQKLVNFFQPKVWKDLVGRLSDATLENYLTAEDWSELDTDQIRAKNASYIRAVRQRIWDISTPEDRWQLILALLDKKRSLQTELRNYGLTSEALAALAIEKQLPPPNQELIFVKKILHGEKYRWVEPLVNQWLASDRAKTKRR